MKSAVSTLLILAAAIGAAQQLPSSEVNAWKSIEPRIGYLATGSGVAVLINDQGYFVAHKNSFPNNSGFAFLKMGTSELVQVSFVTSDETTQLVLLKSDGWKPNPALFRAGAYMARQERSLANGTALIAVLPAGPIRAVLNESDKMGVLPSKRGVTLNEIRFEKPVTGNLGGGLVFSMDGRLMGVLGATLDVQQSPRTNAMAADSARGGNRTSTNTAIGGSPPTLFGPGQMTVAYSVSSDILARVIDGFLSPNRKASLPVVGLFCSDFKGAGAEITGVTPGGNADQAGFKQGDIITKMGDAVINNASDFMRFVLRQEIGSAIQVEVRRGNEVKNIELKVGAGEMLEMIGASPMNTSIN